MKKLLLPAALLFSLNASSQRVAPVQDGDIYSFTVGNIVFELDASFGGRISSFKINGTDILYPAQNGNDFLWGSTLWPSPQTWPWPPPFDALEYDAYAGEIKDNKVILTSAKDDYTKLVFEKTFYVNSADSSVNIEYKVLNDGTSGKSVAAWEVSRVHSGGITFFPRGAGSITGAFGNQFETIDGIAWFNNHFVLSWTPLDLTNCLAVEPSNRRTDNLYLPQANFTSRRHLYLP